MPGGILQCSEDLEKNEVSTGVDPCGQGLTFAAPACAQW
jgi:hypothetical protein